MATIGTFTWTAGTSGVWSTVANWTLTGGTGTPPPGAPSNPGSDTAIISDTKTGSGGVFDVIIAHGQTFDLATLTLANSGHDAPVLFIGGTLATNSLTYTGNTATAITVDAGAVFNIRNSIIPTAPHTETITVEANNGGGIGSGGLLELGSLSVFSGNLTYTFTDTGAHSLNTGQIEYATGFTPGSSVTQTVTGVDWGDQFIIGGANFTGDTATLSSGTLTVKNSSSTIVFTMKGISGAATKFAVHGDIIAAVCYARGTMILTPDGELPVERLRPGKQVTTLVDGEEIARPVKWLGHRRIDLTGHPRPETVAPIRIQQGAFADNTPHRDLVVSPDHAIFADGKLVCARQLVNGTTIRQETGWTAVDYYHVELDQHAILLAEGLTAESYVDTGNSGFFANSGEPMMLHPGSDGRVGLSDAGSRLVCPVRVGCRERPADLATPGGSRGGTRSAGAGARDVHGCRTASRCQGPDDQADL